MSETLNAALQTITKLQSSGLMVVDAKGRLIGLLDEKPILRKLGEDGPEFLTHRVDTFAHTDFWICEPDESVKKLLEKAEKTKIRHIVVKSENGPGVLLSLNELVRARLKYLENIDRGDLELYRQL